jgi:hypothetical protein
MAAIDTLIFVEVENLALRCKEILDADRIPHPDSLYNDNCFVWNQRILNDHMWNFKRLSFCTSIAGDDIRMKQVRQCIAYTRYICISDRMLDGKVDRTG